MLLWHIDSHQLLFSAFIIFFLNSFLYFINKMLLWILQFSQNFKHKLLEKIFINKFEALLLSSHTRKNSRDIFWKVLALQAPTREVRQIFQIIACEANSGYLLEKNWRYWGSKNPLWILFYISFPVFFLVHDNSDRTLVNRFTK